MIAGKKIIVVGGGIGGLSFTNSLIQLCSDRSIALPDIRIYERDRSAIARSFGYTMALRDTGGTQALCKMKLLEKMIKDASTSVGAESMIYVWDENFCMLTALRLPDSFPVKRTSCRNVLLSGIPPDFITWNSTCVRAENFIDSIGQPKVRVYLSDGKTDECDILVVADGSKSKIRESVLPNEKLNYSGVCLISGNATVSEMPHFLKSGFGFTWARDGTAILLISVGSNAVMFRVVKKEPVPREGNQVVLDASSHVHYADSVKPSADQEELRRELRELTKAYGEPWPTILSQATGMAVQNLYDKYPHDSVGHMAFIGDACHPMVPFSGNGANMALADGWSLADQLTGTKHNTIHAALRAFDKESQPRSSFSITVGRRAKSMWTSSGLNGIWWYILLRTVGRTIGFFDMWTTLPVWKAVTGLVAVAGFGCMAALSARRMSTMPVLLYS